MQSNWGRFSNWEGGAQIVNPQKYLYLLNLSSPQIHIEQNLVGSAFYSGIIVF